MLRLVTLLIFSISGICSTVAPAAEPKPLRALLIAGGCCHDYAKQHEILSQGIQSRANVQVDVVWTDDKSVTPNFPLYQKADWAAGYDVIIHDECAAGVRDQELVKRILDAHKTIPSINLHCAMHSFRTGTDMWFKYLGLQSASHGPQEPIALTFVDPEHPITKGMANWTTIKEELYNNLNIFDAHPLAMGKQIVKQKDGTTKEVDYVVAWTNEKSGARSFSTTIGHNNDTVADTRYLDLITRGLLWACDKLNADYQTPFKGEHKVTFIKAEPKPEAPKPAVIAPPPAPKDATLVTATASSEESGKNNFAWRAIDGDEATRWCANSPEYPQWLQLELDQPRVLSGLTMSWENNGVYTYNIETSPDGKAWTNLVDASHNEKPAPYSHDFTTPAVKFIRINALSKKSGGWASIREVKLKGEGIKVIAPKMTAEQKATVDKAVKADADPYKTEGNIPPKITKLTADQEKAILADVKVPEGFDLTLFASPSAANYPVYVAAAPNGDLYVSSDGNGSLGRNPKRGRILRLRDTDGDGRADQVTEFVKDVDSPRGLVWDHDRLYLIHPPHVSVFIDKDGDGISDESKILINGIAFGFDNRPADHTTNGLSLGIDGWLYIAGGDFGFMDAVGTDGKHLQHRGGGVIRFRPDGTGLELFATGTRNILGTPISPTLDIFARDNTNDGGGWDVRFHHFTGLEDHGYPRLYKNFGDEHIKPLADYGGGSGCGSTYLSEPGFPKEWNDAPLTCDWGTGALWKHTVQPKGATFEEIAKPEPLIKMTRPTDADVDGLSHIYQASWKGATFNWEGPDVGYIVRVSPKGYKAAPLPDFNKASDADLIKVLEGSSQVRTLEAQRTLLRRPANAETTKALIALAADSTKSMPARVAALYAVSQRATKSVESASIITAITPLAEDKALQRYVLRALGDAGLDKFQQKQSTAPAAIFTAGLKSDDPHARLEAIIGAARQNLLSLAPAIAANLGDADPVVAHTTFRALALISAHDACLAVLDNNDAPPAQRLGALRALMRMHTAAAVDSLLARLTKETKIENRKGLLSALSRLHYQEGEWKGDSWGTRPDTRGPYYQPETWAESAKIAAALKDALAKAGPDEAAYLVGEMNRNRIQSDDALQRILTLAKEDTKLVPEAVAQLATAETIPAAGIPLLIQALQAPADPKAEITPAMAATLAQAITALSKTDSAEGCKASLVGLLTLSKAKGSGKEQESARTTFFGAPKLENHHQLLETEAEKAGEPTARLADMALLNLSQRKTGSPESRELSQKALDHGWTTDAKRRIQIIDAVRETKTFAWGDKVLEALTDSDPKVAKAADNAVKQLKLQPKNKQDKSPLIGTMKPEDVIAQVIKTKGDATVGEQLFTKQTCVACHTTSQDQPQKGPYLGNIAQTYKRPDLAVNILDPNKTIAQGFTSEVVTLNDGTQQMGFITLEAADSVKLRNVAAQEFTFAAKDIKSRQKLPISIMPPGLVNNLTVKEFASLLDYLEALAKKH